MDGDGSFYLTLGQIREEPEDVGCARVCKKILSKTYTGRELKVGYVGWRVVG